jgi:hypothetical protein
MLPQHSTGVRLKFGVRHAFHACGFQSERQPTGTGEEFDIA